jgi:predicted lipoprotein with Yx(FWY)xxD motif
MRTRLHLPLLTAAVVVAGCGGGGGAAGTQGTTAATPPATQTTTTAAATGTRITLRSSEFGRMLFDGRGQAIYLFDKEKTSRPECYGECAAAWPPVYADGEPVAGPGVRSELLGTTRRRDGRLQVTYGGHPLYFYANEGAGEVKCHNVFLNGGLWLVVGANGQAIR